MTRPAKRGRPPDPDDEERLRFTLDDETVDRLRDAANRRGIALETLVMGLVVTASHRIDELLDDDPAS